MKNSIKWIIVAVLLVGLLTGAVFLYNKYSDEYFNQGTGQQTNINDENVTAENTPEDNVSKNPAPDFTVTDMNGNEVSLSDYKGKPVVLNFWATWCYYCKVEMPDFNEAYKDNPDIQFLMVNATEKQGETPDVAKAYIEGEEYAFEIFFDTEYDARRKYGVTSFPQTVFIDKDGNVVSHRIGMLSKDALQQEINKIK